MIAADLRNTSRTCPRDECGYVAAQNRPTQDAFHCVACGHRAHIDTVGAVNVLRPGWPVAIPTWVSEKPPLHAGEE
ncbi:zinc ribbon domain-containing protein [Kitasatospora sp. NPDC001683]